MAATTFTDHEGRDWRIVIHVGAARRVRDQLEVDLLDIDDQSLFGTLASDPYKLVDVIYVLCKEQAEDRCISDEQFGALLTGNVIESATDALMEALLAFFPGPRQTRLRRVWETTRETEAAMLHLVDQELDQVDVRTLAGAAMAQAKAEAGAGGTASGDSFTNSPASSASTPLP